MDINQYKLIGFIIIFFIFIIFFYLLIQKEFFTNIENVDFYVITMGNPDRLENITRQIEKMNNNNESYKVTINKTDAVVGKNLDLDQLIKDGILTPEIYQENNKAFNSNLENRKNEVGCCMSHYKTYQTIANRNSSEYSVIFEDDFDVNDEFLYQLDQIITDTINEKIHFDILMLAIVGHNGNKIYSNIETINCKNTECYLAHAYLINNKSIDKILDAMKFIDKIADVQIFEKHNEGKIKVLRLESSIVNQNSTYTTIRNN
jgi:GR25 family glycosyltransferase involved in LPS biosynthesis